MLYKIFQKKYIEYTKTDMSYFLCSESPFQLVYFGPRVHYHYTKYTM